MQSWVLPIFLGLGLAAASGLRTFLPLLMLAAVTRFNLFGVSLNEHFAWLGSDLSLIALGIATVVELGADKIPVLDHALSAVGTVTRPMAGALAAGAVLSHSDPAVAVLAGLIIGAPTAFAVHTAQSSARVVSTTTTAGMANPLVSLVEDMTSAFTAAVALVAPIAAPIVVGILLLLAWRAWSAMRRLAAGKPVKAPDR